MRRTAAVDGEDSAKNSIKLVLITCAANRGGGRVIFMVTGVLYLRVLITCAANRGGGR